MVTKSDANPMGQPRKRKHKTAAEQIKEKFEGYDPDHRGFNPGRVSKYDPKYDKIVFRLCLLGFTQEEMANHLDVSTPTFKRWLNDYPSFRSAALDGEAEATSEVINAMFLAAKGYQHPDVEIRTVSLGGNAGSEIRTVDVIKHYAPDVRAAQLYLLNSRFAKRRGLDSGMSTTGGSGTTPEEAAKAVQSAIAALDDASAPSWEARAQAEAEQQASPDEPAA